MNRIGLIVGGAVKAGVELSGMDGIQASGKRTADEIADRLEVKFKEQGWIDLTSSAATASRAS